MPIIPYASTTGTRRNLAALRAAGWRLLVAPGHSPVPTGFRWCVDNGAWGAYQQGRDFDGDAFWRCLDRWGEGADFIVVPDIVEGGRRSLELSLDWLPWLDGIGRRRLIPVQDDMYPADVAHLLTDEVGVFVGGSTAWKLATVDIWASLARRHGSYCHVGRVNSKRRIRLCQTAGANSFDGTSATRFSVTLPRLDAAVRQGCLVLDQEIDEK